MTSHKFNIDRDFLCIIDIIYEIIYGLSFAAITFELGPRSEVKNAISANILKITRDRDFIGITDI